MRIDIHVACERDGRIGLGRLPCQVRSDVTAHRVKVRARPTDAHLAINAAGERLVVDLKELEDFAGL